MPDEKTAAPDLHAPSGEAETRPSDPTPEAPVEIQPHRVVEAILFASDAALPAAKIAQVLGVGTARDVKKYITTLNAQYADWGLSFRIEEIAGGYRMLTQPAYNTWLTKLLRSRQEAKLSQAAMETLSIVAYKQPCTRADVEAIRGVAAGDLLNRLREMNLVKIVGRAEDLGRPLLYGTARRFLEVFGLPSLEDLPQVEALAARAPAQTAPEDDTAAAETNEPPIAPDDASETADARDDADARPPEADDGPHLALAEAPDDEPLDASDGPNDESSSSERQAADPIE